MNWLEFAIRMTEALAWPIVILLVAWIFRKQIVELTQAIRKIKVWHLEAEVERVKEEAAATISQLRDLALALAAPAAGTLPGMINHPGSYSFSSPSVHERLSQGRAVVAALVKLGVDKKEAEEIMLSSLLRHIRRSHVEWIKHAANKAISEAVSAKKIDEPAPEEKRRHLRELPIYGELAAHEATPSDARKALSEILGDIPEELEERLADLEHFEATGEIRRHNVPPWGDEDDRDGPS